MCNWRHSLHLYMFCWLGHQWLKWKRHGKSWLKYNNLYISLNAVQIIIYQRTYNGANLITRIWGMGVEPGDLDDQIFPNKLKYAWAQVRGVSNGFPYALEACLAHLWLHWKLLSVRMSLWSCRKLRKVFIQSVAQAARKKNSVLGGFFTSSQSVSYPHLMHAPVQSKVGGYGVAVRSGIRKF